MTSPTIPDTAPFSPSQRAWLNGFFAGLLGKSNGNGAAAPAAPPNVADDENFPWHDPNLTLDQRMEMVKDKPLEFRLMGAMAQLDCGQCGYLCRTYSKAIADGKEPDMARCVPGGRDTSRTLRKILKEQSAVSSSHSEGEKSGSSPLGGGWEGVPVTTAHAPPHKSSTDTPLTHDRNHPFPAPVLAVERLNAPGSAKDTRFVSLGLASSGLTYKVGDSAGVYPRNCYQQVDALVRVLNCSGAEPVSIANRSITLREALISDCDIDHPSDALYELLAASAADAEQAQLLRLLAEGAEEADGLVTQPRVIDAMARFTSARPTSSALVNALGRLQPRLYSISSSPLRYPDEVHLTVAVVRYELSGQQRKGVASTFMADRILPYEPVRIFIQPSHNFALTDDPHRPIIMVGPGTGIAPFRAFLQERESAGAPGSSWLFFGDQHETTDFLYRDELERWLSTGLLTRLDTAFSRDQDRKIYVQHRMIEHGRELFAWLADGACFYVCGDAKRMAKDVDLALRHIISEHGGMSDEQADAWLKQLADAGRYQRDVY